jgi:FkbM family methyltransferase
MSYERMFAGMIRRPIETLLQRFDKAIVHRPRALTRRQEAQLRVSLPMLLSELYVQNPAMTLVQVGALDGLQDDPLDQFLAKSSVRSILIEPQPHACRRLRETHAGRADVTICNVAIDGADRSRTLYTVATGPGVPPWAEGLASFDKATILRHSHLIPHLEVLIRPVEVDCVTPHTLMTQCKINDIHALIIDTEGYDMEVLRSFWAAGVRPAVICLEHKHLSRRELQSGLELLIADGYSVVQLHADVLAKRAPR